MKRCLIMSMACATVMVQAEINVGDAAPDFSMVGSDGKTYTRADLKGDAFVIAWFPKAFTGG